MMLIYVHIVLNTEISILENDAYFLCQLLWRRKYSWTCVMCTHKSDLRIKGTTEEPEIKANACFHNAIQYEYLSPWA